MQTGLYKQSKPDESKPNETSARGVDLTAHHLLLVARSMGKRFAATTIVLLIVMIGFISVAYILDQQPIRSLPAISVTAPTCGTWHVSLTQTHFSAVNALSADNIWFAGAVNAAAGKQRPGFAHWDGKEIKMVAGPDFEADEVDIRALAVNNDHDAWAVGYATLQDHRQMLIFHWDGLSWTMTATPVLLSSRSESSANIPEDDAELFAVTVVSSNDAWAVGYYEVGGTHRTLTLHWDGTEWKRIRSPNRVDDNISEGDEYPVIVRDNGLSAVVHSSGSDVWAFGYTHHSRHGPKSLALHWDGVEWKVVDSPKLGLITGASIDRDMNLWLVNGSYNAENWLASAVNKGKGNQWDVAEMPRVTFPIILSVGAYSFDNVWAVGYKWSDHPPGANSSQVGARSLVMHWDGVSWGQVPGPDPSYIQQLFDVAVVGKSDVWTVGTSRDDEDSSGKGMIARFQACSSFTATDK